MFLFSFLVRHKLGACSALPGGFFILRVSSGRRTRKSQFRSMQAGNVVRVRTKNRGAFASILINAAENTSVGWS